MTTKPIEVVAHLDDLANELLPVARAGLGEVPTLDIAVAVLPQRADPLPGFSARYSDGAIVIIVHAGLPEVERAQQARLELENLIAKHAGEWP